MPSSTRLLTFIVSLSICGHVLAGEATTLDALRTQQMNVDFTNAPIPQLRNGWLVARDVQQQQIRVWTSDGKQRDAMRVSSPELNNIYIRDVAVSRSGALVVALSAMDRQGRAASFLGWFDEGGKLVRYVRTAPFSARSVVFAEDGSLWAGGWMLDEARNEVPDYDVLRHYSNDGQLLKTAAPRRLFAVKRTPLYDGMLVAGDNGHIWIVSQTARTALEFSQDGTLAGRWELPTPAEAVMTGAAVFRDSIYFSLQSNEVGPLPRLYRLNKTTGAYSGVQAGGARADQAVHVLGQVGNELAVRLKPDQLIAWLRAQD